MRILPFSDAMLDDAAGLLTLRHTEHRQAEPSLPSRQESPDGARAALAAVWGKPGATGVAAVAGDRLIGYLVGTPREDRWHGRSAWIPPAGHAVDPAIGPDLYGDLYAALGARFVAEGYFTHAITAPCLPATVEAWFGLCFGREQVYAVTEIDRLPTGAAPPEGVDIRRAGPADLDLVLTLGDQLARHQSREPVWAPVVPERFREFPANWAETLAEPDARVWLALRGAEAVGLLLLHDAGADDADLLTPAGAVSLTLALTRPEERGRGVARALMAAGLAAERAAGARLVLADWRSANLPAARVWSHLGFRPTFCRLIRQIDPRIAWARG